MEGNVGKSKRSQALMLDRVTCMANTFLSSFKRKSAVKEEKGVGNYGYRESLNH